MTLSALIKRDGLRELATATHATPATLEVKNWPTVATVATVAVADPSEHEIKPGLSTEDELKIRKWFTSINETDPDIIAELLENCRTHPNHREYFLERAEETPPIVVNNQQTGQVRSLTT